MLTCAESTAPVISGVRARVHICVLRCQFHLLPLGQGLSLKSELGRQLENLNYLCAGACVLPCLASVLGIQTQVLLTAQRVFSPLSQLPSPTRTSLYSLSLVASTANTGRIFPSCCLQVLGCAHYTFDWMVYTKLHYLC